EISSINACRSLFVIVLAHFTESVSHRACRRYRWRLRHGLTRRYHGPDGMHRWAVIERPLFVVGSTAASRRQFAGALAHHLAFEYYEHGLTPQLIAQDLLYSFDKAPAPLPHTNQRHESGRRDDHASLVDTVAKRLLDPTAGPTALYS